MAKLTDANLANGIKEAAAAALELVDKQVGKIRHEIERKLATKKESESCDYTVSVLCEMKIDLDSGEISPNGKLKWSRADGVDQKPGRTVPLEYVEDPNNPDLFNADGTPKKAFDATTPQPEEGKEEDTEPAE